MSKVNELRCRECDRTYAMGPIYACDFCFAPLEAVYDYDAIGSRISASSIAAGPLTIWRYHELLPVDPEAERVDIGAGFTPLLRAHRLAIELGIEELYLKNDCANPTHSFKDRVVSVALTVAKQMKFATVACASTGNLANAVAAHAARAGLASCVFIPSDLEAAKILSTAVYGGTVVAVKGNYDEVNRLCSEIAQKGDWGFVNVNLRPFYSEGSKTLAFEIAEQLGWQAPGHIVIPVASGALLTKVRKGLNELALVGLSPQPTTSLHAAQAQGCNPVVTALRNGTDNIRPVKPDTIAKSLAIGDPADGYYAVKAVNETSGRADDATDDEIRGAIRLLASTEGIFTETAGGVTIAVLRKLAEQGAFADKRSVVALITGMGLKTSEALTDDLGPTFEIPANIDAFEEEMKLR